MIYRKLEGYKYELLEAEKTPVPFVATASNVYITMAGGWLVVKARYAWDGPSGPTIDTKTFMRGSLFHDALYQLIREGLLPRKYRLQADQVLRDVCLQDGMNKFRAWYVYHAVRIFAEQSSMFRKNPRGKIVKIERL